MKIRRIRLSRLIIAGLILGIGLLLGNYLFSSYLVPNQAQLAPELAEKFQKPADWGKYSNMNQALGELTTRWSAENPPKLEDQNGVIDAAPDTLKDQILRLRAIFDEEVRFRRESLNNNLKNFQTRLIREMNQKLEEERINLNNLTAQKISEKEKELKTSSEKYRSQLRTEYQKRLINLSLQVLVEDNQLNVIDKSEGLSESQTEINRLREEYNSKLIAHQHQITDELTGYSKQLHEANQFTLSQLRARLSESISREVNNFQTIQENSYQGWYQKRSREISSAIELRAKDSLSYSQVFLGETPETEQEYSR